MRALRGLCEWVLRVCMCVVCIVCVVCVLCVLSVMCVFCVLWFVCYVCVCVPQAALCMSVRSVIITCLRGRLVVFSVRLLSLGWGVNCESYNLESYVIF